MALTLGAAQSASAQAIRAIGGTPMARGDDNYDAGFYGFEINYYGAWSDAGIVCTNGYMILNYLVPSSSACAFPGSVSASPPRAPNLLNLRTFYSDIMAPFFSDIRTNFAGSPGGDITLGTGIVDGRNAWAATWNHTRGYPGGTGTTGSTVHFQLALIERGLGTGDFTMEFNYGKLSWGAEGGIGFTNGDPNVVTNFTPTMPASDTRISCEFTDGSPVCSTAVLPEPSTFALVGTALAGIFGVGYRRRRNNA